MIDRIGAFEILGEIGRGGMGVVFLARDARLDRQVAIKALPEHLASDPVRLERFEREAKTLAGLTHPNVAGIYGVEEQDGAKYLVLEYVDGETLQNRIDRGPLPVDEAVEYAVQIAAGVEAAHEAGVIHRDLKPANVKITPDGLAKVLDFGLARREESGSSSAGPDSPTMLTPQLQHSPTIEGAILGTAAYMSPEQARGRRVDKRTDIWSFGVVLYEMLVGASPFHGETATDSIGAVLHKDLDLGLLPPETPSNVRRMLERCLERDKSLRYRDIGDVRLELLRGDELRATTDDGAVRSSGVPTAAAVAGAVVLAGIAGVAGWFVSRAATPEPDRMVRKLEIMSAGPDEEFDPGSPRISPDGMKIAFIQDDSIRVRDLSTFDVVTVAQAEGAKQLAWSPDGRTLAFASQDEMFRVPAAGGGVAKLGDYGVNFAITWTDDDRILFSDPTVAGSQGILELPARGGTPQVLIELVEDEAVDFHALAAIPGTDVLLFVRHRTDQRTPIEAWDGTRSVVIADFEDQYVSVPSWSPTGHVLFTRGFGQVDLWAVAFSPGRMEVTGDPFLVQTDATAPSVSADGTLSFVRGSAGLGGEIVWILPDGSIEVIGDGGDVVQTPMVSPDGTRVAFAGGPSPTDMGVWVRDLERGINTRISSFEGFVVLSAWSPDGTELAVMNFNPAASGAAGRRTHFIAADGSGATRQPYAGLLTSFDRDWTNAAAVSDPRSGKMEISAVDLADMSTRGDVTSTTGGFIWAALSPNADLLLYQSTASGTLQVYCTRFPSGEGRWQVSADGGNQPSWSPDGSTAYYISLERELIRVPLTRDPEIRFGLPEQVFPAAPKINEFVTIRPAPDGRRFISTRGRADVGDDDEQVGFKLLLIENWYEEFRESEER